MNNYSLREIEKSGILITKDKLIEVIRKSNQATFMYSVSQDNRQAAVIIPAP